MPNRKSNENTSERKRYSLDRPAQDYALNESVPTYFAAKPAVSSLALDMGVRRASLFRNGRNQAVRIPREFELPPGEVSMHREGDRLIIVPVAKASDLAALFASWEPLTDEFPDVDTGLLPLPDVAL